jgi:hypothetical protein
LREKGFSVYIIIVFSISCYKGEAQENIPDIFISAEFSNKHLKECLYDISDQSGLKFGYRTSLIDTIHNVSFKFETNKINSLLDSLLHPLGIDYVFKNRQILLKKLPDKIRLQGYIVSLTDSLSIPYASLSLKGRSDGTISDYKGIYQWELSRKYMNDTIIISSMGYNRKYLMVNQLMTYNSKYLFLEESFIKIDPVIINKKEFKTLNLGNKSNRSAGSLYLDTHGQQTGLHVENIYGTIGSLLSISVYLAEEGNLIAPFRVRIYNVDSLKGTPIDDVLDEILIAKPNGEKGWFLVDLISFNISFPEHGLFIAMEGIFPNDYDYYSGSDEFIDIKNNNINTPIDDNIPLSLSYGQQIGYNRKLSDKTWHYSLSRTWFQLPKQQYGVLIKASVRFVKQKRKKRK